jgi:hypothetical protein
MSLDLTSIVVSAVTAGSTLGVAWAAKRVTPRQDTREDFTLITGNLRQDVTDLKKDLAGHKVELTETQRKVDEYEDVTRWLARWFRSCVGVMRESHLDIPPRPTPEPARAAEFLHDIGV